MVVAAMVEADLTPSGYREVGVKKKHFQEPHAREQKPRTIYLSLQDGWNKIRFGDGWKRIKCLAVKYKTKWNKSLKIDLKQIDIFHAYC